MALYSEVKEKLHQAGAQHQCMDGLERLFSENSPYCNPFREVSTQHHQLAFLRKNFNFTVSVEADILNVSSGVDFLLGTRAHHAWRAHAMERMWTTEEMHLKERRNDVHSNVADSWVPPAVRHYKRSGKYIHVNVAMQRHNIHYMSSLIYMIIHSHPKSIVCTCMYDHPYYMFPVYFPYGKRQEQGCI